MAVEGVYLRVFFVMVFFGLTIGDDAQPRHVKQMKVDLLGKGDFRRIQDAIDSVPSDSKKRVLIMVEPGIYKEKVTVPADKTFITLRGRKNNASVITWDDGGDIHESPTVSVFASNFIGHYLTIQNTHGPGAKAVALRVTGDTASFKSCRILSYQDTLLDEEGTHHYSNCYIEGAIDFIFGNAASIFKNCHLHSLSQGNWAITAQNRKSSEENTGFFFIGGKITGIKTCILGRPWGPYSRVVFAYTYMSKAVLPQGWDDWGKPTTRSTVYYGEYKCYGPGANRSKRVWWSRSVTEEGASLFLNVVDMIDDQIELKLDN